MSTATEIALRLRRLPMTTELVRSRVIQDEYEAAIREAAVALIASELALEVARLALAEAARQRAALEADVATLAGRIDAAQVALLTVERERDEARKTIPMIVCRRCGRFHEIAPCASAACSELPIDAEATAP